ncbi:hypothetical protein BJV78DRAFT_1287288 [Lactifluus subvellereus]|nr:hypothetical protein BJV78DRAFT_1287288 [Lactifluus subvellereus]
MHFFNSWRFSWKKLVDHGEEQLEQTRFLLETWGTQIRPREYSLVEEQLEHAEGFKHSVMAKPFWARSTPATLFSSAADDALKTIKVVLSGDALV